MQPPQAVLPLRVQSGTIAPHARPAAEPHHGLESATPIPRPITTLPREGRGRIPVRTTEVTVNIATNAVVSLLGAVLFKRFLLTGGRPGGERDLGPRLDAGTQLAMPGEGLAKSWRRLLLVLAGAYRLHTESKPVYRQVARDCVSR
jgi:hypothetical protein